MYDSWDMEHNGQNVLSFWTIFWPFTPPPPTPPPKLETFSLHKKSRFWKNEKMTGDIIFLHMCTINDDPMMYGFWDVECDRFFCHLGPFFALLHS